MLHVQHQRGLKLVSPMIRQMRRVLILVFLIGALVAPYPSTSSQRRTSRTAVTTAVEPSRIAERITAAELRDYLFFIASDEMEGRDTPSRGLDLAAKFIAMQLSRWGIKPGGDNGTYFQQIALNRYKLDPDKTSVELGGEKYKFGDHFLAQVTGTGQSMSGSASGPLVYVSHGWVVKDKNIDAYTGISVKDKIMIVAGSGFPRGITRGDLIGERGDAWSDPITYGQKNEAKGAIIIPSFQNIAFWDRTLRNLVERGSIVVEKFQTQAESSQFPVVIASPEMLTSIFRSERQSAVNLYQSSVGGEPLAAFDLSPNKTASLTVSVATERLYTQNVIGIAEGSDPILKNEYVAIGAHYDHVGIGNPVGGDAIYNGADDDGSGTVAMLTMAHALSQGPRPKRSMLFVWHAGEEKGLWGSRYFVENPTVPLGQIVTQINIDMIGRSKREGDTNPANRDLSGPNEVYVIGSRVMSTELGELTDRVNSAYLNLSYNYRYDDPKDPNRFFFRSDHYNYAQKGIPIVFFFTGVHEDYHRPGDHPDKIDYQKLEKVTQTIFMTAWEIANLSSRPKVDKQLPSELRRQ